MVYNSVSSSAVNLAMQGGLSGRALRHWRVISPPKTHSSVSLQRVHWRPQRPGTARFVMAALPGGGEGMGVEGERWG